MKILHWTFVFVALIIPISIICRVTVNSRMAALKDEVRINNAIDTATKDAIDQIITVSGFDYDNEFGGVINITPKLALESINTFFHTLAVNYNIPFKTTDLKTTISKSSDSYIKNYFAPYVPAVVIIAYDGFYIYSQELTSNGYEYQLSSKIPYTCEVNNNGFKYTVGYTLGNDIYLSFNNKCYSGKLKYNSIDEIRDAYNGSPDNSDSGYAYIESLNAGNFEKIADSISYITDDISMVIYALNNKGVSNKIGEELIPKEGEINFLQDYTKNSNGDYVVGSFHKKRREVIIKIISDCLREEINVDHNRFADITGSTYDFYLPEITQDDWINSINDIAVMAFVQGIPVGTLNGNYYNNYALGGSQIVARGYIYGNTVKSDFSGNNVNLYHKDINCKGITDHPNVHLSQEAVQNTYDTIFLSEDGPQGAIENGYLPCQLCN